MKRYSPYIRKHINDVKNLGYTIHENGKQLQKNVGKYEILMTDLTIRSEFTYVKTMLIWIKNTETMVIEVEKLFRNEILPLSFHKINDFVETTVQKLGGVNLHSYNVKKVVHDIKLSDNILNEEFSVE